MAYLSFKGRQIYYDVTGDKGKPIIILNGIMMSTDSWNVFVDTFSENNILIRVDFFDQGRSDRLENSMYTQEIQVDVVEALLKHLEIDKVNVIGISYGGEVALQFAIKHPDLVDRLLLFNTTANTNPWLADIGHGWNEIAQSRNGRAYYLATIPIIYSPNFYKNNIEWIRNREQVLTPVFSDPVFLDRIDRLTYSAEHYDVREELHKVKATTLIVASDEDYLTPVSNQEYLNKHIEGSYLVMLPGVGHASMYEKPMLFSTLCLGFINSKDTEYKI